MPKTALTKQLIADTLKQLAYSKHPDKISISEIVDAAGLNRQTFYYHFQDKQELIGWIFDDGIARLKDRHQDGTLLDDILEYLYSERNFYIAALTSVTQNNLREHIFEAFQNRFAKDIIALAGNRAITDVAIDQVSRFFANGLTGNLVQWAESGMRYENVSFTQMYASTITDLLRFMVDEYTQ